MSIFVEIQSLETSLFDIQKTLSIIYMDNFTMDKNRYRSYHQKPMQSSKVPLQQVLDVLLHLCSLHSPKYYQAVTEQILKLYEA